MTPTDKHIAPVRATVLVNEPAPALLVGQVARILLMDAVSGEPVAEITGTLEAPSYRAIPDDVREYGEQDGN